MYNIEFRLASKNGFYTPDEARRAYGRYSREGFTVHWWGRPGQVGTHDATVNYILRQSEAGNMSVNYVCSNDKITMMVNPDNVAWASTSGNPTTISCEFQPDLGDEGYKKAGWLINELEGRYGHTLSIYPHNKWNPTECPGSLDLARMRKEADRWKSGYYTTPPAPVPVVTPTPTPPAPVLLEWERWKEGKVKYVLNKDAWLWNFNSASWTMQGIKKFSKGEPFEAIGQVRNTKLNAVYYLTEFSFNKGITNGVNAADLDIYVPPRPVPVIPVPTPEPATPPAPVVTPPVTPDPVVTPPVTPAEPVKDPLPEGDPPAPLPTPENNPVRPKVKAGVLAGAILTAIIAAVSTFVPDIPPAAVNDVLTGVAGLTTLVSFIAAYFKRDGLSPK